MGHFFFFYFEKIPILIFPENFISVPDLLQESFIKNPMQQHCVKLHVIIEFLSSTETIQNYKFKSLLSGKYYRLLPDGVSFARNADLDCVIPNIHCLPDEVCITGLMTIMTQCSDMSSNMKMIDTFSVKCDRCFLWREKRRRLPAVLCLPSQVMTH